LADHARGDVGAGAGWETGDDAHRLRRIGRDGWLRKRAAEPCEGKDGNEVADGAQDVLHLACHITM